MLFIQHWLWEELNSLIKSQGAERPDLPYAISLREGMLVYTVAFHMSQMIQNHHFPLSFCWRGSTVGGGSYKKQKLCKDHLVWAKKKKENACFKWTAVSICQAQCKYDHVFYKWEDNSTQSCWWWGCWLCSSGIPKRYRRLGTGFRIRRI